MGTLKRAWLYITRKRGRSVIVFALICAMSVFALLSFAVKTSADRELERVRRTMAGSFKLKLDFSDGIEEVRAMYPARRPRLDGERIGQILQGEHIKEFFPYESFPGVYLNLTLRPGAALSNYEQSELFGIPSSDSLMRMHCVTMFGFNNSEYYEAFRSGAFELTQGRHIRGDDKNAVVISEPLAQRNGLTVGDTFTFELRLGVLTGRVTDNETLIGGSSPIEVRVVGLYKLNFEEPTLTYEIYDSASATKLTMYSTSEASYAESTVLFDSYSVMQALYYLNIYKGVQEPGSELDTEPSYDDVTFYIDDPANMDAAIESIERLDFFDGRWYKFDVDDTTYKASAKPLKQLSVAALIIMLLSAAASATLLALLIIMWTRSRKQELNILWSVGIKKRGILAQLLFENLFIALAALLCAVALSAALAGSVGGAAERAVSPDGGAAYTFENGKAGYLPEVTKTSSEPVALACGLTGANIAAAAAIVLISTSAGVLIAAGTMKPKGGRARWVL